MTLENLHKKPIPPISIKSIEPAYDKNHKLVDDPMVLIGEYDICGENYYSKNGSLNYPYYKKISDFNLLLCRKTIANKLAVINHNIAKYDLEIFVLDAFRPLETQQKLWEYFKKEASKITNNPDEVEAIAKKYCSSPDNYNKDDPATHPVHTTGGAIDLTLRKISSKEHLFMGSVFDDDAEISKPDFFENKAKTTKLTKSEFAALYSRRILHHLMVEQGFAPHINEWWHFDYGTKLWAKSSENESNSFFYSSTDS